MKLVVDTHTHSVSSGHAYSTIQEMAKGAADNGIEIFALTDHGPSMLGAPAIWHFGNLTVVPERLSGVRILKGVEANIIDYDGNLDMPDEYLARLEFVIASFHDYSIRPGTENEHTNAVINTIKNPYVDGIAHPGNPQFQIDIERVVKAAAEHGKFLEINNHSSAVRIGSEKNCMEIARACVKYGTNIMCGSDAHISFDIGKFENVRAMLDEVGMPEDQVLNTSAAKVEEYLSIRRKRLQNK
jgi:putative hydrolase